MVKDNGHTQEVLARLAELPPRVFNHSFGTRGRHSRTAYTLIQLPKRITIELEITFAYSPMV